jgi:hypothetical protein
MSVVEPGSGASNLVQRVINILTKPAPTWDEIEREPTTIQGLFTGYAAILALIPAVGSLLAGLLISALLGPVFAIVSAVLGYVLSLAGVFVVGLIADAMAPSFDGQKNRTQAMKLAVYSWTATWVGGILVVVPLLGGLLALAALAYGFYLFYLGAPKLMKTPPEKTIGYTIVTAVIGVVIYAIIGAVVGMVVTMAAIGGAAGMGVLGAASQGVTIRDGDTNVKVGGMNLAELEAQSKRLEAAAKQMESGQAAPATDPELLKAYLPAQVAGFARQEVSSSTGSAGPVSGSTAEGKYVRGDARFTLTVVDMGSMGAIAGMAGAMGFQATSESNGRYEKVGKDSAGRTTMEEFDRNTGHGKYAVMAGDRFMITAEGEGARIEELKAAVMAANPARLEQLAKS